MSSRPIRAGTSARRQAAGAWHEANLEAALPYYRRRQLADAERHHVPTRVVRRRQGAAQEAVRMPSGVATVDFTGAVNVLGLAGDRRWRLQPVAFDVKGVQGQVTYRHKPEQMHQIVRLLELAAGGWWAFLLLVDEPSDTAWILHTEADLMALRMGRPVTFCSRRAGVPVKHYAPHVMRDTRLGHPDAVPWFDWRRLVIDAKRNAPIGAE